MEVDTLIYSGMGQWMLDAIFIWNWFAVTRFCTCVFEIFAAQGSSVEL